MQVEQGLEKQRQHAPNFFQKLRFSSAGAGAPLSSTFLPQSSILPIISLNISLVIPVASDRISFISSSISSAEGCWRVVSLRREVWGAVGHEGFFLPQFLLFPLFSILMVKVTPLRKVFLEQDKRGNWDLVFQGNR